MCPRSSLGGSGISEVRAFFCQGSIAGKDGGNFGTGEHLPKPPFCKPPILTAPTRNSPERIRNTIRTFPKKSGKPGSLETPSVWNPPPV